MYTLNRLNLLLVALHMPPVRAKALVLESYSVPGEPSLSKYRSSTPVHDILHRIDRQVGIITTNRLDGSEAPVGERLRRLERHIKAREHPPYFWLGADAENLALTG